VKKRVVYLHHGLLMNSEVWVCLTDAQRALPFVLVDRGFDVWVSRGRGLSGLDRMKLTKDSSWGTTEATNTPRSRSIARLILPTSGTSPSTSSLSTISRTASPTFSRLPVNRRCRTSASRKERPRPLPVWLFTRCLTTR
jgi:hypothetical protein